MVRMAMLVASAAEELLGGEGVMLKSSDRETGSRVGRLAKPSACALRKGSPNGALKTVAKKRGSVIFAVK